MATVTVRAIGPRPIVRQVSPQCITAEIACGEYSGNILFIPRIPLSPTDAGLSFTLRRRQFHVRPAFAMTTNKAQGQTLQRSGVLLDKFLPTDNVNVASSRCGDRSNISFLYRMVRLQTSSTQKCCRADTHLCRLCTTHFCRILYKGVLSINRQR